MNKLFTRRNIVIAAGVLLVIVITILAVLSQQKHTDITDETKAKKDNAASTTKISDLIKPTDLVKDPINTTQNPDPNNDQTIDINGGEQLDNNIFPAQSALVVSFISQYVQRDLGKSVTSINLIEDSVYINKEGDKMTFNLETGDGSHQIKVDILLFDTNDGVNITFTDPKGALPKFNTGDVYYDLYFTPSDPSLPDTD
jgi:hypothetical protein